MSLYYKVDDVMELMECSDSTAYRVIKELNVELNAKGIITLAGKINKKYFHQRYDVPEKQTSQKSLKIAK